MCNQCTDSTKKVKNYCDHFCSGSEYDRSKPYSIKRFVQYLVQDKNVHDKVWSSMQWQDTKIKSTDADTLLWSKKIDPLANMQLTTFTSVRDFLGAGKTNTAKWRGLTEAESVGVAPLLEPRMTFRVAQAVRLAVVRYEQEKQKKFLDLDVETRFWHVMQVYLCEWANEK